MSSNKQNTDADVQSNPSTTTTPWRGIITPQNIHRKQDDIIRTYRGPQEERYITVTAYSTSKDCRELYLFTLFEHVENYTTPYRTATTIQEHPDLTEDTLDSLL